MKKEIMDQLDINTISKKKNLKNWFSELILLQLPPECYTISLKKQKKKENLNPEKFTLLTEFLEMNTLTPLTWLNSIKLKVKKIQKKNEFLK